MIKWKRFFSNHAIYIYIIITVVSLVLISFIGEYTNILLYLSISTSVISVAGFLVTINQLLTIKEVSEENEKNIKIKLDKYFKTILFQDFSMKFHVLEITERRILADNWTESLDGMRKILGLIDDLQVLIETHEIEIGIEVVNKFRGQINLHISAIERKLQYPNSLITKQNITSNIRELGSLVNRQITKLKSQLT